MEEAAGPAAMGAVQLSVPLRWQRVPQLLLQHLRDRSSISASQPQVAGKEPSVGPPRMG